MNKIPALLLLSLAAVSCNWFSGLRKDRQHEQAPDSGVEVAAVEDETDDDVDLDLDFETGTYYTIRYKGDDYFFRIDRMEEGNVSGSYYRSEDAPVADPHPFSVELGHRRLKLDCDGRDVKINPRKNPWTLYSAPEYVAADTSLYRSQAYGCTVHENIVYGRAQGYWCSLPGVEADVSKIIVDGLAKSLNRSDIDLTMDVYVPDGVEGPRPLIMFIHGGAFYIGDKQEPAYVDFCKYFASMGYVTASINYRMGFHVGKGEIERAQYAALQDAHAAMRYLVSFASDYGIDTDHIYVAGSSAGSITALGLAFMREKDRPEASYGGKGLFNRNNMGRIDSSGNEIKADFKIRSVANMWGAVASTDMLSNNRTSIVSFHGTADNVVPFGEGMPFSDVPEAISGMLSSTMYGSACIDSVARANGLRSVFYPFPGEGHAFNTMGPTKLPNANHKLIRGYIRDFFFEDMVPQRAHIVCEKEGEYSVDMPRIPVSWKVDGGFVIGSSPKELKVLWRSDAPSRKVTASGKYPGDIGFELEY